MQDHLQNTSIEPSSLDISSNAPHNFVSKRSFLKSNGTIIFRPKQATFSSFKTHGESDLMDPYCKFKVGHRSGLSAIAKSAQNTPAWIDDIPIKVKGEQYAKLTIKRRDKIFKGHRMAEARIYLDDVVSEGRVTTVVPLMKKDVVVGELFLEMEYTPSNKA